MTMLRLLESDPELGLRIPPDRIGRAQTELVAPVETFEPGMWAATTELGVRNGLGCLVLDGVLARELVMARTTAGELLGEGDLVPPRAANRDEHLVRCHVQWHVLTPLRVAVLDEAFARRLGQWPPVMAALLERTSRRTHRLAVHQALLQLSPVETRLTVLFWHLAERWGRVTPEGIAIAVPLSHEMLGHLVGSRRASVTTALAHVRESGRLHRRADGTWILTGEPPGELTRLHWHQRRTAAPLGMALGRA
jgi:CRP/FNR family cyclic AMP-dependent transcriptional regulator